MIEMKDDGVNIVAYGEESGQDIDEYIPIYMTLFFILLTLFN